MLRAAAVMTVIAMCPVLGFCQPAQEEFDYADYETTRARFGELYAAGELEDGAELLEWALPRFPEHAMANAFNLAIVCCKLGRYERAMEVLEYAHERNLWFNSYAMAADVWDSLRVSARFDSILARNEALRQEAQQTAKPDMLVVTPEGYVDAAGEGGVAGGGGGTTYPLFIALHGGGSNIDEFRDVWTSDRLRSEFIVAYLQSSRLVGMGTYDWLQDLEITRAEIADAFRRIVAEYPIAEDQVIVGGFSSGGAAALEVALTGTVPVAGFVVLCPRWPDGFTEENVADSVKRGLRGTILTTEMDPALPDQEEMAGVLETAGMPNRLIVTPNVGHWIPDDLGAQIDRSIDHIRGE